MALALALQASAADGELLYGPGGVSALRAKASQVTKPTHGPAPATVITQLLARAETFRQTSYSYSHKSFSYTLSSEPPASHRGDNYPYWTGMFQETADSITTRINTLTFAYLATESAVDLEAALDIVLKLAAWSTPSWSDPDYYCGPAPACLDTGHAAMSVAYFYDAARSALTPTQRQTIRSALVDKGLLPLEQAAEHALTKRAHNLDAVVAMGLGVGAAALYSEDSRAPGWLALAIQLANKFLSRQGKDGGALEYHGYGAYAMDQLVRVLAVAEQHGEPVSSPFIDNVSLFFSAALSPDGKALGTFGDSWTVCGAATHHYLAAQQDSVAQGYLVRSGLIEQQDFLTVAWADGNRAPEALRLAPWAAPSVGLGTLRSAADESATLVVFKAGPPASDVGHNQHDHLSFQIWARGAWLMGDPGYSNTSSQPPRLLEFVDGPLGHSTILLDHEGPIRKHGASLTRVSGGTGFGLLCGEAAGTYRQPTASSIQRCLLLHPTGFVVLFDRVTSPHPQTVQWLFQPHRQGLARARPGGQGDLLATRGRLAVRTIGSEVTSELVDLSGDPALPQSLVLSGPAPKGTLVPLTDPGFEQATLAGWTARGGATASAHSLDGTTARSGQQAAKIALASADSGYYYSERFTVGPGDRISASAYARAAQVAGAGARLRLLFWSNQAYHSDASAASITGDWPWHRRFVSGTVPQDVDQCSLALELASSSGEVWFDDVSIAKIPAADVVRRTTRLTALLQPAIAPWLPNSDFSAGMATWRPRHEDATHAIVTSGYRSAPGSARISFPDGEESGYLYGPFLTVLPGDQIEASTWLRADVAAGPGARLRILYFTQGSYVSALPATYVTSAPDWTQQQVSGVVPAHVDQLRVALEFTGHGNAWFDDVAFANSTHPIAVEDHADMQDLAGDTAAFTFSHEGSSYLCLSADEEPLSETTPLGQAQLDQGYAIHATQRTDPTVLIEASQLTVADSTSITLDRPANARFEQRGHVLWGELTAGSSGELPSWAVIEISEAAGIDAATINDEPVAIQVLPGDRARICWSEAPANTCPPTVDGSVDPRTDAGPSTSSSNGNAGCSCSTATRPPSVSLWLLFVLAVVARRTRRRRSIR